MLFHFRTVAITGIMCYRVCWCYRYDKYIQIYKNLIYLYCGIPHEMPSCFIVSDFAEATFVCYDTPQA